MRETHVIWNRAANPAENEISFIANSIATLKK